MGVLSLSLWHTHPSARELACRFGIPSSPKSTPVQSNPQVGETDCNSPPPLTPAPPHSFPQHYHALNARDSCTMEEEDQKIITLLPPPGEIQYEQYGPVINAKGEIEDLQLEADVDVFDDPELEILAEKFEGKVTQVVEVNGSSASLKFPCLCDLPQREFGGDFDPVCKTKRNSLLHGPSVACAPPLPLPRFFFPTATVSSHTCLYPSRSVPVRFPCSPSPVPFPLLSPYLNKQS